MIEPDPATWQSRSALPPCARRLLFPSVFAVLFVAAFCSLQMPFADANRFLMEKDQMVLLHDAYVGRPSGCTIGATTLRTLPSLQLFYAAFFWFTSDLAALFWVLVGLEAVAILALYFAVRSRLTAFAAELLALLFLADAHRHYQYDVHFLPNVHSPPFVIALLLLLFAFHLRKRFCHWHLANVLVCFLINFHALNVVLVLLPASIAIKNYALFSPRRILQSLAPYGGLAVLFLPQALAFSSVLHPDLSTYGDSPSGPEAMFMSLAFFAEHSILGLLGLVGVVAAVRHAFSRACADPLLQCLALFVLAGGLAVVAAFTLAGEVLQTVPDLTYRLRALFPCVILAHFLGLHAVIHWASSPLDRRILLFLAILAAPLHIFDWSRASDGELSLQLHTKAKTSARIYRVPAGRRLASALVRDHGLSQEMLRQRAHLLPLHEEMFFFFATETAVRPLPHHQSIERGDDWVLQLLNKDLAFRVFAVSPCFDYSDLVFSGAARIGCGRSGSGMRRYLYFVAAPEYGDAMRLWLDDRPLGVGRAREFSYEMYNGVRVYRTLEPVDLRPHEGKSLRVLRSAEIRRPLLDVFESPVLLADHIPEEES